MKALTFPAFIAFVALLHLETCYGLEVSLPAFLELAPQVPARGSAARHPDHLGRNAERFEQARELSLRNWFTALPFSPRTFRVRDTSLATRSAELMRSAAAVVEGRPNVGEQLSAN